jgi:hypothetical protein
MRTRPGLLTISFILASSASAIIAMESTQTPATQTPQSSEDATPSTFPESAPEVVQGQFFVTSEGEESAGVENQVIFLSEPGDASQSMQQMRARLADPEQREVVRAEHRANLQQLYSDIAEELSLDSATHEALIDLLTDQQMEMLDLIHDQRRREAWMSTQAQVDDQNRKLDDLRGVLGEEGLERYQQYVGTQSERRQVRDVDARLGAADKLSPEQKDRLIALFKEKNRKDLPPPAPVSRMSSLLSSRDPGWAPFNEDLQRESQLATIAANEEILRLRRTSNRWMVEQAAEFLTPTQTSALSKMNEAQTQSLRQWIEKERARAGLDRAIPERGEEHAPLRKPVSGDVTVELTLKVNGGEPVNVTHTGPNGEPLKFQAADELFVEANWTLFDDDWLDVQLTFFEDGPTGRRRLDSGSGFATTARTSDSPALRGSSGTIVTGRKAYSVELSVGAAAL